MAPVFLTLSEVFEIHRDQIERYGGHPGIGDAGLLRSAVAVSQATMGGEYLHADLFEMPAAYLFHIVKNHPFADGNKRTGAVAALVFLELNGIEVTPNEDELVGIVLLNHVRSARRYVCRPLSLRPWSLSQRKNWRIVWGSRASACSRCAHFRNRVIFFL